MKPNPYGALKKTILTCMIVVPCIPFILALGIGYYNFAASLEENTIASMHRIVRDHRQMIESFLMERKADLEFILNTRSFEELRRTEDLEAVFENLQKESQAFVDQRGLERTVCDYIAGMTDRYAIEEHQKLFNPLEKP